jgi:hypothetical protein
MRPFRSRTRARAQLRQFEDDADGKPDDHEEGESPQKKRGLADGQPRQLSLGKEKARPAYRAASRVVLDDRHAHGRCGVVAGVGLMIAVSNRTVVRRLRGRFRHSSSLPADRRSPTPRRSGRSTRGEVSWLEA